MTSTALLPETTIIAPVLKSKHVLATPCDDLTTLFEPSPYPDIERTDGISPGSFSAMTTNAAYHADKSAVSTSHMKLLIRSYAHYLQGQQDEHESSTSQNLGTALHAAVLEPNLFATDFLCWEGGRRFGKDWDAFKDAADGRIILTTEEMAKVKGMRDAVCNFRMPDQDVLLGDLLARGEAEKTIYWEDPETGIVCKMRADCLFAPYVTFDLKSCGDARPGSFLSQQALKLDYDLQAAVYHSGVKAFTGNALPFVFIAVETDAPHGVWLHETGPGTAFFENGMAKFRYALRTVKRGREETKAWPGSYAEAYTVLDDIPLYARFAPPDGQY